MMRGEGQMRATSRHFAEYLRGRRAALAGAAACLLSLFVSSASGPAQAFEIGATDCIAPLCLNQRFGARPIHQGITDDALSGLEFPSSSGPIRFEWKQLNEIIDANAYVDAVQSDARYHFDACSFHSLLEIQVDDCLLSGSQRLVLGQRGLVAQLSQPTIITAEQAHQFRVAFGSFLHSVQDFYSHTNWVNIHPGITATLGTLVVQSQAPDTLPCALPLQYPTGSFMTGGWAFAETGYTFAPPGQCAHGPPFVSIGGMHKDGPNRAYYYEARRLATEDTLNFARAVLFAPSNVPDNVCMFMTDGGCDGTEVTFALGADDYGKLVIDGKEICTYDNISAAGGCVGKFRMKPGKWYDIFIDYKNRLGSDGLSLTWDQPGPSIVGYAFAASGKLVPLANLRTPQGTGYVPGLRGDYFGLDGNLQTFRVGEGPIDAINNIYNSAAAGSWAGYGYFSLFEERLTGQITIQP
jgi:hypothetical protein